MTERETIREILAATRELAEAEAHRTRRTIAVSPEAAAFFQQFDAEAVTPTVETQTPESSAGFATLEDVERAVAGCTKCSLAKSRKHTVFSDGPATADLMIIGEAPGADEDRQGVPFVGAAGQLLTRIIEKGMGLRREDVYICNVLKCRPPNNRDPLVAEKAECIGYLHAQIEFVKPKVICCLGRHAANTVLSNDLSTGALRGAWHRFEDIPVRVTYHPSYLLHCQDDPEKERREKRKVWDDVTEVMKVLRGEAAP